MKNINLRDEERDLICRAIKELMDGKSYVSDTERIIAKEVYEKVR